MAYQDLRKAIELFGLGERAIGGLCSEAPGHISKMLAPRGRSLKEIAVKPIRFQNSERGVTTVEYAIMIVLVALTVAVFGAGLNGSVTGVFSRMISVLSSAS